jgi:hypothetical protein
MSASTTASAPRMSIVLATDAYDTLRPVIACLRRQTDRAQLEIVIVAPTESVDWAELSVFGAVRVVRVAAPLSLPAARTAGVRAAAAPIVYIGETHCFPQPNMTAVILAAFTDERCAAVVPAILNANPATALSWASYLTDYGTWGSGRSAGELEQPLVYNVAYRRAVLLALGDRLGDLLDSNSEELWPILHERQYYAHFEPAARTDHANATRLAVMMNIRFCSGVLIGAKRARRWPIWRRFSYVLASPLIPGVLLWRVRSSIRFGAPARTLPAGTMLAVAAGAVAKTMGEVMAYLGVRVPSAERRLTEAELHKLRYARVGTS